MSSRLLDALKMFCCCTSADDSDTDNLIGHEHESDWTQNSNGYRQVSNGNASHASAGTSQVDGVASQLHSVRTQSEVEEDALNKILDRTQQCIIDVGNLDNNGGLDIDVAQRARLYSEAVKRHDALLKGNTHVTSATANTVPLNDFCLLLDAGPKISEILSESINKKLDIDEFALLNRISDLLYDAILIEFRVELREELIAYMSQND